MECPRRRRSPQAIAALLVALCALLAGAAGDARAGQITASNVPLGDVTVGVAATGVEVQRVTLVTSSLENGTLSNLSFQVVGNAGLDVATARLVRDPDGAAVMLGSVSGPFFNGWTIAFNGLGQVVATQPSTYALVVDFDGVLVSGGAGATIRTNLAALHATGALSTTTMTEVGVPANGDRDVTVQQTIDGIVALSDPGQLVDAGVAAGAADVEIQRFALQVTQDAGILQALSIALSGTGSLGDLAAAELVFDANGNGAPDDAVIATDTALADAHADFTGLAQALAEGVTYRLFVRLDLAAAPVVGGTYGAALAAGDVHVVGSVSGLDLSVGAGSVAGRTLALESGVVAVSPVSLASLTVEPYAAAVEVQRVTLSTPAGVDGTASSLVFQVTGGACQDVASVSLMRDPGVFVTTVGTISGPLSAGGSLAFADLGWTGPIDGTWSLEIDFNGPTVPGEVLRTQLTSVEALGASGLPLSQAGVPALSSRTVQLGEAPPEVPILPAAARVGLALGLLVALALGLRRRRLRS